MKNSSYRLSWMMIERGCRAFQLPTAQQIRRPWLRGSALLALIAVSPLLTPRDALTAELNSNQISQPAILSSSTLRFLSIPVRIPAATQTDAGSSSAQFLFNLSASAPLDLAISSDTVFLRNLVQDPRLSSAPPAYRAILARGPTLQFLLSEPSGVREGYTIGEHTQRVLEIYRQQKAAYQMDLIQIADVANVDRLMTYTLAFHDIGKSIAYRGGDKEREIIYSAPIATDLMPAAGFNQTESRIAVALIQCHQHIGHYLQGELSLEQVTQNINQGAIDAGISRQKFFALLEVVFVADAGSYPYLQSSVFEIRNGRMVPRGSIYPLLVSKFAAN